MAGKVEITAENLPAIVAALGLPPETPLAEVKTILRGFVMEEAGEPQPTEGTPPEEEMADPPPAEEKPEEEEPAAAMAAASRLFASTGKTTFSAAIDQTEVWRKSHLELEAGRVKLARDREALESAERRELYTSLVALRAETPATLWVDSMATKKVAVDRLAKEPLDSLRKRVAALTAASGEKPPPKPPKGGGDPPGPSDGPELNEREKKMLAGRKPEEVKAYTERKAALLARKAG